MEKTQISWKTIKELAKTKNAKEIAETVIASYGNVGVQQKDELLMITVNSPSTIA